MTLYALRARNDINTAYVSWTSSELDLAGDDAPSAILLGSVVVENQFGDHRIVALPDTETPIFVSVSTPNAAAPNPRTGVVVIQIDTAGVGWVDAGIIYLSPIASPGGRIIVKDLTGNAGTKSITVDGNGNTIDGGTDLVMNTDYASSTFLYDGVEWVVV